MSSILHLNSGETPLAYVILARRKILISLLMNSTMEEGQALHQ